MSNEKLTWDQVDEIRWRATTTNVSRAQLCAEYDLSYNAMGQILRYESWLTKPEEKPAYRVCQICGSGPVRNRLCLECRMAKADYELEKQKLAGKERCDVCGTTDLPANHFQHHVDHNHETGELRGTLCLRCNVAIGAAGDNPLLLERLAAYLRQRSFAVKRTILS